MPGLAILIHQEKDKSSADDGKINQWEFERNSFIELEDNLPRRDPGSLEDVINAYGPWGWAMSLELGSLVVN